MVTRLLLKIFWSVYGDELSKQTFKLPCCVCEGEGKWFRNIDYYRLDGSTNATTRKKWAEEFNDTNNTR